MFFERSWHVSLWAKCMSFFCSKNLQKMYRHFIFNSKRNSFKKKEKLQLDFYLWDILTPNSAIRCTSEIKTCEPSAYSRTVCFVWFEIITWNIPFCSNEIDRRVQDSRRLCSVIIPNEVPTACWGRPASASAGVDCPFSTCAKAAKRQLIPAF